MFDSDETIDISTKLKTEFGDAYLNESGYYVVRFGKEHYKSLHRLVAEKYVGDIRNKEVHHKDCNRRNNHPSNLQIVTRNQHRLIHETIRREQRRKKNGSQI